MVDDRKDIGAYGDDDDYRIGISSEDEENEFPEEENDEIIRDYSNREYEEELELSKLDKVKQFAKSNWLYGIILLALVVPALLQLKHMIFPPAPPVAQEATYKVVPDQIITEQKAEEQKAAEAAKTEMAPAMPTETIQNAVPTISHIGQEKKPASNAALEFAVARDERALEDVHKQIADLTEKLTILQDKLNNVPTAEIIAQASESNNALQARVEALAKQVQELNTNTSNMVKSLYQSKLSSSGLIQNGSAAAGGSEQTDDFVVHATIPGRAWLRNRDGVLVTVREGEMLPGYGRVMKINPAKGTVTMDSNRVFREEPI